MSQNARARLDDTLFALREKILAELPAQLDGIRVLVTRIVIATGDTRADLLDELERAAHAIAGRAAMFELPEIMESALGVERLAVRLGHEAARPESNGRGDSAQAQALGQLVGQLAQACASAAVEPAPVTH